MDYPYSGDIIFALDIGTRTVIGIVCKREGSSLKIIAESIMEHGSRSMIDGQVHDIEKVAQVVIKVKEELQRKVGFPLREVAIAAAGRTLKTVCVHVDQELDEETEIDSDMVNGLELMGVNQANKLVHADHSLQGESFYCVGYSVVTYYLNNYPITNLIEHSGKHIGADVLATFLPYSVVNSLYKVLEKSDLVPISLTLEPIAALEAIVPENIRLLNIALVDIGAGTSDIAITRGGTITAYGMVSVAGDEITEAVAQKYLLDFNTAEMIKRKAAHKKKVSFKDITGAKVSLQTEVLRAVIDEKADMLASEISKVVLALNGGSPKALFCVGGGSMTPGLIDALSRKLNMDKRRIVIKKRTAIPNLETCGNLVAGPEGVTVTGIAIVAFKKVGHDFIEVFVNRKGYRLFNSGDLAVKDVLALTGYNPSALIGKSGKSIKFTLNKEMKRVPGEPSEPPEIKLNGETASMTSAIKGGDSIIIKDAVDGRDAQVFVSDYLNKYRPIHFMLDGENCIIEPLCMINGVTAVKGQGIKDGDAVNIEMDCTLGHYVRSHKISMMDKTVTLRGKPVDENYTILEGDTLEISRDSSFNFNVYTDNSKAAAKDCLPDLDINNADINNADKPGDSSFNSDDPETGANAAAVSSACINVTVNGKNIILPGENHIFIDIFTVYDLDISKFKGKGVSVMLNGKNAEYSQTLHDGDVIEIK